MTKIINQRESYLAELHAKSEAFAKVVVAEYNGDETTVALSAAQIAAKHINPKTGKPYSRQHIHKILNRVKKSQT